MFQNNLLMAAASISAGGFTVDNSVRYNDDDSPRLYKTPAVLGNRWTSSISLWYKRCSLGSIQQLYNAGAGNDITFNASDKLTFIDGSSQGTGTSYITTQEFSDPTAWGHLLFAWNTTLTTAGDRLRIYHNGVEITAFDTETNPTLNSQFQISNVVRQTIGANESDTEEFDGYLSQVQYVDGIQNVPTDFGEFNNGVWRPIEFAADGTGYSGTVVPIMTGATAPSGTVTETSVYTNFYGFMAFDNVPYTAGNYYGWINNGTGAAFIAYEFASSKTITMYTIGARNANESPENWTFEGWNGSAWITLDTVTGASWSTAGQIKVYTFSNTTAYIKYQLNVSLVQSAGENLAVMNLTMHEASSGYGTNGFFLNFADSSDLGNDVSGNNNDYTSSGLTADDQMTDTPTNNYPTFNPLNNASQNLLKNGNRQITSTTNGFYGATATTGFSLGQTAYWETTLTNAKRVYMGLSKGPFFTAQTLGSSTEGSQAKFSYAWRSTEDNTVYYEGADQSATISKATAGQTIAIGVTSDGEVKLYVNNSLSYTYSQKLTAGFFYVPTWSVNGYEAEDLTCNFGTDDLVFSLPAGTSSLETSSRPTPAILDGTANFQTTLYTGSGSARNIDQTGNSTFQPDFVWLKNVTDGGSNNMLFDAPRGVTKVMNSNLTAVEATDANSLTSFDADGFGLGSGAGGYNDNTKAFFAYQWLAGGGAGSANAVGSITTTTTTVNTAAGISIGTYTGTGSAATIGHGLGAVPKMIIVKERANDVGGWFMYHAQMSDDPETDYMLLNSFSALVDDSTVWNDTAPTSTVFSIGTHDDVNGSSDTYVYYAFAEVEGFSKFGSYTGNGAADGPYVYTGFKPALITYKSTASAIWPIFDSARNPLTVVASSTRQSFVNYSTSPETYGYGSDFFSSGFKLTSTDAQANGSGQLFVYWSFAEYPFGGDGASPATTF